MNFFKKQRVAFYGLIVSAVLLVVSMIMFTVAFNNSQGFFAQQAPSAPTNVALDCIFAIVLMAAAVVINQFNVKGVVGKVLPYVADILIVVAFILVGNAFVEMVKAYAYDMAIWLGSELHNGDDVCIAAIKSSIVSSVLLVVSIVVGAVTSCFSIKSAE